MFPPNLQKNIQELERQITLLETECEHIEMEKQETTPTSGKTNSKPTVRELPNQPFITGPCVTVGSYSSKILSLPLTTPKIYSASCAYFRTSNEKFSRANVPKCVDSNHPEKNDNFQAEPTSKCPPSGNPHDEKAKPPTVEKRESTPDQKQNCNADNKKVVKRPIGSIKEVSESSEENFSAQVAIYKSKPRNNAGKEQTWCELLREQSPSAKRQGENRNAKNSEGKPGQNSEPKLSSDEERKKELITQKTKSLSGNWMNEYENQTPGGNRVSCKRRSRSARTKKNYADEIPVNINITKSLLEKEIQCALWDEQTEKDEFFNGLNESIKILHFLIAELKTKLSREKRESILNDMQKTLMKVSGIKSMNATENPLIPLSSLKETGLKLLENKGNILDVKNTLLALKQFCQELSEEKLALTEELSVKNRTLANCKSKEKEYLSLIASLKFNLEKMKEEADEGARAKRDLKILKIKLQEEAKVIEALKKSHEKMQELIENYVLENDKLRAQVKIVKLESQKFNVLLAGKEAEIIKYKKEIESFQKQITEQLSLLRSKATENEVEQTIEAISNQRSILQRDVESLKSEYNENLGDISVESSTTITQPKTSGPVNEKNDWDARFNLSREEQKPEAPAKNGVFPSNESVTEADSSKRLYGLERVLSSSKNLRSSINELLEDIRRESTEMYWRSPSDSCATSSQSAVTSTSSENVSEDEQNN